MKLPQVFRWFLGFVLTIALAMIGGGFPPSAYAQHAPLPPQSPFQTIIHPGDGVSRTLHGNVQDSFPNIEHGTHRKSTQNVPTPQATTLEALTPEAPTPTLTALSTATANGPTALILYDANPALPYNKLGHAYAIMLRNLLGHFHAQVDFLPIEHYVAGAITPYQYIFYLGALYDNPIPAAFFTDVVAQPSKTVVWFKYNLWQFTGYLGAPTFAAQYGFNFLSLRSLDGTPSASNPNPGFFDTVLYKGKALAKFYRYDPTTGAIFADPDMGLTQVVDATKAQAVVTIRDSKTTEQAPYIVRSGNFWYVADLPFSYIGPRDRYLVICDILHDILHSQVQESHRALVRLEDLSENVDPSTVKTVADYLSSRKIPFALGVIPLYEDPLGWYNDGIPQEIHFANATNLLSAVRYATRRGGSIVLHGYTHQYNETPNPYTAVSGDDFEFWRKATLAQQGEPVAEDSLTWALGRIDAGLAELATQKIVPFAWETPHYQGSANVYRATAMRFAKVYERAVYYTSDNPTDLDTTDPNRDFAAGQFFPYIIESDYYGRRVLPENLGNIEYDISNIDPTSNVVYTWQDLFTNAQYALIVRDGFASFFFHPFWLESYLHLPAFQDFQSLIKGITGLGFIWVDSSQL